MSVHTALTEFYKGKFTVSKGNVNAVYVMAGKSTNQTENSIKYIGEYIRKKDDNSSQRIARHSWRLHTLLRTGTMRAGPDFQTNMYVEVIKQLVEEDEAFEFFVIEDIPYDAHIIEGAIKFTELVSEGDFFSSLANVRLESHFKNKALMDIFKKNEDVIAFARFYVYNLFTNVHKTKPYVFLSAEIKNCPWKPNDRLKCLVGLGNLRRHLHRTRDAAHISAMEEIKKKEKVKAKRRRFKRFKTTCKKVQRFERGSILGK